MKMVIPVWLFTIQLFYHWHFMEFQKAVRFQKDLIFISATHYFGYAELLQMIIDEFGNQNRDLTV